MLPFGVSSTCTMARATSPTQTGWKRLFPLPGTGTAGAGILTSAATMLKKPSRSPQIRLGLRIVQSSDEARTKPSPRALELA